MKKAAIIIAVLLTLLIGVFALALSNANSIVGAFKPDIESALSSAVGSKVKLGKLSVSIFPDALLKVDKFTVKQKGSQGLSLDNLTLDLSLLPLLSGNLKINEFSLDKPSIRIITSKDGAYIDGLKGSKKGGKKNKNKDSAEAAEEVKTEAPLSLDLNSFSISEASIEIVDQESGESRKIYPVNIKSSLKLDSNTSQAAFESDANLTLENQQIQAVFKLNADKKKLDAPELIITAFDGEITGKTSLGLKGEKALNAELSAKNINAGTAFSTFNPAKAGLIEGTLDEFDIKLSGSNKGNFNKNLSGSAEIALSEGSIQDFNLAHEVLKEISTLPFFRDKLMSAVPEEQKDEIVSENTAIESMTGTFTIADEKLSTNDLYLLSTLFSLKGAGSVSFDGMLNLKGKIVFNKAFSAGLAGKIKELGSLMNAEEEIVIPLVLKGKAPDLKVEPDLEGLLEAGAAQALADKAAEFLSGGKDSKDGKGKKKGLGGLLNF